MKEIGKRILLNFANSALTGSTNECGSSCGGCPNAGKCKEGLSQVFNDVKLNNEEKIDTDMEIADIKEEEMQKFEGEQNQIDLNNLPEHRQILNNKKKLHIQPRENIYMNVIDLACIYVM